MKLQCWVQIRDVDVCEVLLITKQQTLPVIMMNGIIEQNILNIKGENIIIKIST